MSAHLHMSELWIKTWREPEGQTVEWILFSSTDQDIKRCRARTQREALEKAVESGIEPGKTEHVRPRFGRPGENVLMDNREFFRVLESMR